MLRRAFASATVLGCFALVLTAVLAEGTVKSGPQVGEKVPGPFHPLNINGSSAGKKNCLFCANGPSPVAVVFARELTPQVSALIKKLDDATVKNSEASMGSYAVFCSDAEGLRKELEDLAAKEKLSKLVLSIDNPAGPKSYEIAKDASVTVLLYNNFTVRANYSFAKGDLNDAAVSRIVADVSKITK